MASDYGHSVTRYSRIGLGTWSTAGTVAAAVALLLAGCGDDDGEHGAQPPGGSATASEVDGVQVVTVVSGNDLRFAPSDLFAHVGTVKIIFKVTGKVPHNLAFKDGTQASTGTVNNATTSMTLKFDKPGVFHFLCTIHPYMQGTLTIS